jgi:uncharacterized heparinase superfamily protein
LARLSGALSSPLEAALSRGFTPAEIAPDPAFRPVPPDPALLGRAQEVVEGRFTFLNQEADFSRGVDWTAGGFGRLWSFNLHYFDFGFDLAQAFQATREQRYAQRFCELAEDWIAKSPVGRGDAWHPYPLSLRLVNWIGAWHVFGEAIAPSKPALARSMALQARYLSLHLERDIGGNHLVKNAKALAMTGAFLGDTRLMERGIRLLEAQIRHQVLPDGGHFERSPMYHVQVLQDLAETAWYLKAVRARAVPRIEEAIASMSRWLSDMTLPDGEIPLFGDSAHGIVPRPASVLSLSAAALGVTHPGDAEDASPVKLLPDSGFLVTRHQDQVMVLDCGPFAPDELPAHGHCDALSFELCLGAERFIVDSGTFAYTGPRRSHFRGTAAHNTVAIPGREQTEIWGDFRAGRRARIIDRKLVETGSVYKLSAAHDGYHPLIHRRELYVVPGVFWLILDTLDGGAAPHAQSRLHVHPDRMLALTPEGALIRGKDAQLQILTLGGGLDEEVGSYSERFGSERPCRVLVQKLDASGRAAFLLVPDARRASLRIDPTEGVIVEVEGSEPLRIPLESRSY